MLAIILTVLKIIGIILLCLLVTILVLAGLVLFVPVRYRAAGYYREDYAVSGRISWLLHLITVKVSVRSESELQLVVRLLGIPIYDMQRKKQKAKKQEEKGKVGQTEEEKYDAKAAKPPVPHRPGGEKSIDTVEAVKQAEGVSEQETLFQKCKDYITNIKYTFHKICDKIKNVKDNITYYMELCREENTKLAFAACKKELLRIWKDIRPKRFRVNALLGMDDPGTTGQLIGYCAMLYPVHQGNVVVVPDFENKVFEADFSLKGKLTVYVYIMVAYTVLFNKNIRHLKKCLLREDS